MQKTSSRAAALPATRARLTFTISAAITIIGCVILSLAGYVRPVVMGVVQGLGEFLPISSSAHLILTPWLFGWQGDSVIDSLSFDVALHLGTLVAVVAYFWRDWLELIAAIPGYLGWLVGLARGDRSRRPVGAEQMLHLIVIATIPGAIAGVLLDKWAEHTLRSVLLIAGTLSVMGVLLYLADSRQPQAKKLELVSWRDSLLIGLAQACALIPGVSRSGATITMSRFLTLDRESAARFSFLLSAPLTAAAVVFKLKDILPQLREEATLFLVGVLVSGAVGALAIGFLLNYIRRAGFGIFAIYRVMLAIAIVLVYFARI